MVEVYYCRCPSLSESLLCSAAVTAGAADTKNSSDLSALALAFAVKPRPNYPQPLLAANPARLPDNHCHGAGLYFSDN